MRVGFPFGPTIGPGIPDILAQNDLRRLAALELGLSLDGFVVTAICSFEPGFCLRYEATPLRLSPPFGSLPADLCHAAVLAVVFFVAIYYLRFVTFVVTNCPTINETKRRIDADTATTGLC